MTDWSRIFQAQVDFAVSMKNDTYRLNRWYSQRLAADPMSISNLTIGLGLGWDLSCLLVLNWCRKSMFKESSQHISANAIGVGVRK